MELRDWLWENVCTFGILRLRDSGVSAISAISQVNFEQAMQKCSIGQLSAVRVDAGGQKFAYYLFWDERGKKGYRFKVRQGSYYGSGLYFLWGRSNWLRSLRGRRWNNDLLKSCSGCACYNDLIVNGWCKRLDGDLWVHIDNFKT